MTSVFDFIQLSFRFDINFDLGLSLNSIFIYASSEVSGEN